VITLLKDRRRAQSGTTLVELLVSVMIMGLALVLIVGTFSAGLLNAAVAKRNTATEGAVQYELDNISGSQFNPGAQKYSECFATDNGAAPVLTSGYKQPCPDGSFSLRADVSWTAASPTIQVWTVAVTSWPGGTPIGSPVQVYKVDR
jgi:type II secretory pathway pseudopilin PulG